MSFSGKNKGEGYLGEVSLVRISGTDSQNKRKTMDLVVKCASKSENLRNQLPISAVYKNELHVYNTVFPTFGKFEKDRNVTKPFSRYVYLLSPYHILRDTTRCVSVA